MKDIELWLGDCLEKSHKIKDNSVDMVFFDPPYVGMVNQSWDRLTPIEASTFFNSIKKESFRILRNGGRFISFSSNDTLRYLYDESLEHRELLIIDKDAKVVSGGRNTSKYKQHINATEYIYVATKNAREYCREILLSQKGNLTPKEINIKLGVASNGGGMWSIYTGENKCSQVPTKEQWEKFKKIFPKIPEYETFEEYFENGLGKGNILYGYNFRMKNRLHPTQKPLELLEYIIKTYSRRNDLIVDFTMGVGSIPLASKNTGRRCVGIEKEKKYYDIAVERLQ